VFSAGKKFKKTAMPPLTGQKYNELEIFGFLKKEVKC
jgi:hypothetical protein